jgi:hypothetical protein
MSFLPKPSTNSADHSLRNTRLYIFEEGSDDAVEEEETFINFPVWPIKFKDLE